VKRTCSTLLICAYLLTCVPAPAPALEIVDAELQAFVKLSADAQIGTALNVDDVNLPPDPERSAEAFLKRSGFFGSVSSSGLAEPDGNIEVGVDNLGAFPDFMFASTSITITASSQEDPIDLEYDFSIPAGEVILLDPRGLDEDLIGTPSAGVSVTITAQLNSGAVNTLMSFKFEVFISDGEVLGKAEGNLPLKILDNPQPSPSLNGFAIDKFRAKPIIQIPANSTAIIKYEMTAFGTVRVFETGFKARLGDPLDTSAASPPVQVRVKPAAANGLRPETLAVDPAATALSDGNGVFEPGETVSVEPAWRNNGSAGVTLTGAGSGPIGPGGPEYSTVDGSSAYGTIAPDAASSCSETGDCYSVSVSDPATRPGPHWDATLAEIVDSDDLMKTWTLHLGESFPDVPRSQLFYKRIETIFHHGITVGCSPTEYCPSQKVPRSQMAIFIARALAEGTTLPASGVVEGSPYDCSAGGTSLFADVPPDSIFCKGVHFIASQKVSAGCAPTLFCPDPNVTRAEMAIFMAKGMVAPGGGEAVPESYGPDPVTGFSYSCAAGAPNLHFTDAGVADPFCKHAHFLWARGVIAGCSETEYCPSGEVGRDEMAKFLANAFELELYGP
jgi:hypothetical protein